MILINEEINPRYYPKRKQHFRHIEKTLKENNFDKYSILRSLGVFDEVSQGLLRFASGFFHETFNTPFFCKITLENNRVYFNVLDIRDTDTISDGKKSFPNFLSRISSETNSFYTFKKVENGFLFSPKQFSFGKKWCSVELKKSRKDLLKSGMMCIDGHFTFLTYYKILRIMTTTNVKIHIHSKDGNSINVNIETRLNTL